MIKIGLSDNSDEYNVIPYTSINIEIVSDKKFGDTIAQDEKHNTFILERGKWRDSHGNLWEVIE